MDGIVVEKNERNRSIPISRICCWDIVIAMISLNQNVDINAFPIINYMDKHVDQNNSNTISNNIVLKENQDHDDNGKTNKYLSLHTNHTMEQYLIGFLKIMITNDP